LLAEEQRDWPAAERLQRVRVAWNRQQVERLLECGDLSPLSEFQDAASSGQRVDAGGPCLETGGEQEEESDDKSPHSQLLGRLQAVLDKLDGGARNTVRSLVASLHELGEIQRERNHADCVASYRQALDLAELLALRSEAAIAAFNLGTAYKNVPAVRDLDQADQWYRRSLDLCDERDRVGRARCHNQLGSVAFERFRGARAAGRPESELLAALNAALAAYQQALALLPANAVNDLAVTHTQLGEIYRNAGDFDRALPHYRKCIRLDEASGNLCGAGQTRFNVALALRQAGRLTDAREYARAALRNFEPYGPGAADVTKRAQQLLARIEQDLAASPQR
jgi:tetratricopeptide (TPR) repeat protein